MNGLEITVTLGAAALPEIAEEPAAVQEDLARLAR